MQVEQLWPPEPLVRTDSQLAEIARNNTERDAPRPGYPSHTPSETTGRLFMTPQEIAARTSYQTIGDTTIRILDLPAGHDAIDSPDRQATLADEDVMATLLYDVDPEFATGQKYDFFAYHPERVQMWLAQGCRDFTTQGRPLIPGIDQLLSLRTEGAAGDPLGIPTGMGSFVAHGLWRMVDGVILYEHTNGELDVLLRGRPEDGVWATVGGFGTRWDLDQTGNYSPERGVLRRCVQEVGLISAGLKLFVASRDYPVSSPTTASAGLVTDTRGVLVGRERYEVYGRVHPGDPVRDFAGWVSVRQLLEQNGNARDGHIKPGSQIPVWTTHMRYIADAVDTHTKA